MAKRTRNQPVAIIGQVRVLRPTATTGPNSFFRLTWTKADGTPGRTTATKDLARAKEKAREIDHQIAKQAAPRSATTLGEIVAEYTADGEGRNQRPGRSGSEDWTDTHLDQVRRRLERITAAHQDVSAFALDRHLLDRMRAIGGSKRMVRQHTSDLRGLLAWAHAEGYITTEQAELLPPRCTQPRPADLKHRPKRRRTPRMVGQHLDYVADEDAPSSAQVLALAEQMQLLAPCWGALAVQLAAGTGLRWGEQFQLTADDICFDDELSRWYIRVDWQINPAWRAWKGNDRRTLPKGNKRREVTVPTESITGYRLTDELVRRADEARTEQLAGTNPEALLFPTVALGVRRRHTHVGGLHHHTTFSNRMFDTAALAAGWEIVAWTEIDDDGDEVERMQFRHTWHSLRHRAARTAVDVWGLKEGQLMSMGGWENVATVANRYYRSGAEHTRSARLLVP